MNILQYQSVGILLTQGMYCCVNALILGYLLYRWSHINRFLLFFNQALIDSAVSLLIIIGTQAFFVVYFCRMQYVSRLFLGPVADRCIPGLDLASMILHSSLPIVMVIGLIAMTIQFFFVRSQYADLDDDHLMFYLVISNGVASLVKYGFIVALYA